METATQMTTGTARLSYPQLWEAKSFKGGKPKFSATLLIPKTDKKTLDRIKSCVEAAKADGKDKSWKGSIPKDLDLPLHDGDADFNAGKKGEECKGHFYLNAKSEMKPVVLDEKGDEMLRQADVYAGCYVKAAINFFPYNNAGKGVGVGLNAIKKVKEGEPFSSRPSAEELAEMFEDDENDAEGLV